MEAFRNPLHFVSVTVCIYKHPVCNEPEWMGTASSGSLPTAQMRSNQRPKSPVSKPSSGCRHQPTRSGIGIRCSGRPRSLLLLQSFNPTDNALCSAVWMQPSTMRPRRLMAFRRWFGKIAFCARFGLTWQTTLRLASVHSLEWKLTLYPPYALSSDVLIKPTTQQTKSLL